MKEDSYRRIMDCSFFGYACHRIILDGEGKPMDYEFVEVNAGFEKITGLKAEAIVNRRITEVLPGIVGDPFDWIGFYGRIALHLTEEEFEQYSEPLGRWYKINAYAPEKFYFTTVLQDITKEREHSEQLDRFFSVNLDLLCIADTSGHFIKVNREWEAILGYSAQELEERTFLEFVHPNDLQGTLAAMAELSGQKPVLQFVNRYRCKDGSYRHIEWRSHPHGSLIYAAARDVTERIRMEEELRRSREMLQSVMDTIPQFIFWKDRNSVYLGCNQNGARIAGVASPEAIVGKTDYDLAWKKEEADFFRECDERVMSSGKAEYHIIEPQLQADGKQAWLNTNKAPLRDREGNVIGILVTFEDITERIRIEDKLAVSEDRFSRAIAGTGAGLWDWDMVENTVYFSPLWKSMLGYEDHEIENDFSGWNKLWHPEDAVRIQKAINDHLEERTTTYEIEHRLRHKDGGWRWILTRGDIHKDTAGKMVRWVGTNIDITERKRAEEKLNEYARQMELNNIELDAALVRAEQAGRAKGEFLANMSHEIRTPMNVMIGLSELLMQTNLSHKQRDYLNKISTSSRMLLGIINDILDYSKIEAGRLELDRHAFHLDELLDQLKTLFAVTADEKGLELLFRVAPDVPRTLTGDSLRLGQVLTNLLGNALKFTEQGQVVLTVEIAQEDRGLPFQPTHWDDSADGARTASLRFEVWDSGIGMDRKQMARLFQPFSQADTSTTRRYGGTGLGLVISRRLVERMGGELAVDSAPGQGSIFFFELILPVVSGDMDRPGHVPPSAGHAPGRPPIPSFAGSSILLVEDNLLNQEVAREMLHKTGARITIANNGAEAVELALSQPFDMILMDLQMPVMDGFDATRRIRAEEVGSHKSDLGDRITDPRVSDFSPRPSHRRTPIIALSAAVMEADRNKAREAGMDAHLAKPIDSAELYRTLSAWLENRGGAAVLSSSASQVGALVLPALDGFEMDGRLKAFDGDAAFYLKMLHRFKDQLNGEFADMGEMTDRGGSPPDPEGVSARRKAHTLKGLAAMVGAVRLTSAATAMDHALGVGVPIGPELRRELAEALEQTRIQLRALPPLPSLPEGNREVPVEDAVPAMSRLLALLRAGELVESDLLDTVTGYLQQRLGDREAGELAKLVDEFEQIRAAALLVELAEKAGVPLT